jgi:hypothetical protein
MLTQEPSFYVNQIEHEHQIDLRVKNPPSLYLKYHDQNKWVLQKGNNVATLIKTLSEPYEQNSRKWGKGYEKFKIMAWANYKH